MFRLIGRCFFVFILLMLSQAQAIPPAKDAFLLTAKLHSPQDLTITWQMPTNTFLYKNSIDLHFLDATKNTLLHLGLPPGITKHSPVVGNYTIYPQTATMSVSFQQQNPATLSTLALRYQGCTEEGVCYPPTTDYVTLNTANSTVSIQSQPPTQTSNTPPNWLLTLFGFFGVGLLLTFTPCVLPMLPILSSMIIGQTNTRTHRALLLSTLYVLSMASTYAVIGLIMAMLGENLQLRLQTPVAIAFMSAIFCLLAFSLLGFYNMNRTTLMSTIQGRLQRIMPKANIGGVIMMGALATLIVSPCTTPALVAAMTYIGSQGNRLFGASSLFIMGLGMGLPLILLCTLGARFIPKSGPWMQYIKPILGIILLALAIMMLNRLLPSETQRLLWVLFFILAAPLSMTASFMRHRIINGPAAKTVCLTASLISVFFGGYILLHGMNTSLPPPSVGTHLHTKTKHTVTTLVALNKILEDAKKQQQPVFINVYASWCLDCTIMHATTLQQASVKNALDPFVVVRVDISTPSANRQALLRALGIIGPPAIILVSPQGTTHKTLIGLQTAKNLSAALKDFVYTRSV